jgi:hypothetical protein
MKVKCVSTASSKTFGALHYNFITIDKIYEVLSESEYYYEMIGDNNEKSFFNKHCFVGIDVIREDKVKQLGI